MDTIFVFKTKEEREVFRNAWKLVIDKCIREEFSKATKSLQNETSYNVSQFRQSILERAEKQIRFLHAQGLVPGILAPQGHPTTIEPPPLLSPIEPLPTPPLQEALAPQTEAPRLPSQVVWSLEQEAIFQAFLGPDNVVVRARAGCGKTTTALEGIARYGAVHPRDNILFISFANKIVKEAKEKISAKQLNCEAMTYHTLGYNLIRQARLRTSGQPDEGKRKLELTKLCIPKGDRVPKDIFNFIGDSLKDIRGIEPHLRTTEEIFDFLVKYNKLRKEYNDSKYNLNYILKCISEGLRIARRDYYFFDFADMIFLPSVLNLSIPLYNLIVIDECQDTNDCMLQMAVNCLRRGGKIVAIGDDKQAIYSWRGADSEALDHLKEQLSAVELGLTATYRCPKAIVELVTNWVDDYKSNSTTEAVIEEIALSAIYQKAQPNDFVLSRTNAPLVGACLALIKNGKPAKILGRDIGKGIQNKIKNFVKEGASTIEDLSKKIDEQAQEAKKAISWLQEKDEDNYLAKLQVIIDEKDFILSLLDGAESIDSALARIETLFTDDDKGFVVLATVHKIKGLESERVFMLVDTFKQTTDEERNIDYVAKTRSKKELYFVHK